MKVVILCGGQGTRLREETEYRPKPMVPIGDRPILWHIMKIYAHHGHKDFILCLGYKGEVIKDYFRNYLWHTSDVTLKLGREPEVQYHTHHDEEDWTVTLLDTGAHTETGGRLAREAARHLGIETAFSERLFGLRAVRAGDDRYRLMRLSSKWITRLPKRRSPHVVGSGAPRTVSTTGANEPS